MRQMSLMSGILPREGEQSIIIKSNLFFSVSNAVLSRFKLGVFTSISISASFIDPGMIF
jgi:hypothetical protein